MNGFEAGLGSEWLDLEHEPQENREKHLINDAALAPYLQLYAMRKAKHPAKSRARELFGKFVAARRASIAEGFAQWLDELRPTVDIPKEGQDRLEPNARLFNPTIEDKLRRLNYDNRLEDQLIKLATAQHVRLDARPGESSVHWLNVSARDPATKGIRLAIKVRFDTVPLTLELHAGTSSIVGDLLNVAHDLAHQGIRVKETGKQWPSAIITTSDEDVDGAVLLLQHLNGLVRPIGDRKPLSRD